MAYTRVNDSTLLLLRLKNTGGGTERTVDIGRRYSSHSRSELTHAILLLHPKSDAKLGDNQRGDIHDRGENDTADLEMQQ